MLQIVTKMYFRDGVPLRSTTQRDVVYTNRSFLGRDLVSLPIGELAPSSGMTAVSTVAVSVTEYLEAERPDGRPEMLISTGGTELIDDLADVLSFGLNGIVSRDHDLVRGLVPTSLEQTSRSSATSLFRRTFDPSLFVQDSELDHLRAFMAKLLALNRSYFEASMKAIRRVLRASRRAVDDPTIAYTDLVAALESLSSGSDAPAPTWEQMDGRKRSLVNAALEGSDPQWAGRVRDAVMEAERLGMKNRFVQFVLGNVSPEFFRAEAVDAIRPIRGADLERAVKLAYDVRSRNVHSLWDLPREAWVVGDRADTVSPPELGIMLSLEGMGRLARHVIRAYVDGAPAGVDSDFDWRASLPNLLRMQAAPQYWIHHGEGFDRSSAARYFGGFVQHLLEVVSGRSEGVSNMNEVLARIEKLVAGTADGPVKTIMVAIYALWHGVVAPTEHRERAAAFLAKHEHQLHGTGMPSFVVGVFSNELPDWSTDEWSTLATERRADRSKGKELSLPAVLDAALQAITAERLVEGGRRDEAVPFARYAVEELPGNNALIAWEAKLVAGQETDLDLGSLIFGLEPDSKPSEAQSESLPDLTNRPVERADASPDDP